MFDKKAKNADSEEEPMVLENRINTQKNTREPMHPYLKTPGQN